MFKTSLEQFIKKFALSTNDKISINMRSDGDVSGIGSAMVVIVKK